MRALETLIPLLLGLTVLVNCGEGRRSEGEATPTGSAVLDSIPAPTRDQEPTIVFLGTSLTAGLGLDLSQAYPALIQERLDSLGYDFQVINAGQSGETSAGALGRIGWLLRRPPAVLVLETGANDGLRGIDPASVEANIQAIIDSVRALAPATRVVLAGMQALPNLGSRYRRQFEAIYPRLAERNRVPLVPFLLDGVGGVAALNQADGIHPTARGQRVLADNVWPVLAPIVRDVSDDSGVPSR